MPENPYLPPIDAAGTPHQDAEWCRLAAPWKKRIRWCRILGYSSLMFATLLVLSIAGVLIAWLPAWLGILMLRASDNLQRDSVTAAEEAMRQLALAMKLVAIFVVLLALLTAIYLTAILTAFSM